MIIYDQICSWTSSLTLVELKHLIVSGSDLNILFKYEHFRKSSKEPFVVSVLQSVQLFNMFPVFYQRPFADNKDFLVLVSLTSSEPCFGAAQIPISTPHWEAKGVRV